MQFQKAFFLILLAVLTMGSSPKTDWGKRANDIYWGYNGWKERGEDPTYCIMRANRLADEMAKAGETFQLVTGFYGDAYHAWVEYKGKILDPSVLGGESRKYRGRSGRRYYEEGKIAPEKEYNALREYRKTNTVASLFEKSEAEKEK